MSKGEQTKQLIVSRALSLAHSIGLEQVTLGMLATELDLSKSGLFAHFKSKEALQLDVIAEVVDRFTKQVVLPALSVKRGTPRLEALFDTYMKWIHGESRADALTGCIFVALTYEYDDRPGPVRDALLGAQRDWFDSIARMTKSAIDQGDFLSAVDPKQFAFEFEGIAMAHQLSMKLSPHRASEALARRTFASLLARSTTR